jgi:hypothetical protein
MRDAMLAVSGDLNLQLGGQSFYPTANRDALEGLSKKGAEWKESSPQEQNRRSIYMFTKRSLLLPLMTVFDFADTTLPCAQRNISTVAPQALALLNNDFVHAQSDALARRVVREAGPEKLARIERAWWLALSRAPTPAERDFAVTHLAQQRERFSTGEKTSALADKPVTAADAGANATATSKAPDKAAASTDPKSTVSPEQLALSSLCHVLLNLNEFIYVD